MRRRLLVTVGVAVAGAATLVVVFAGRSPSHAYATPTPPTAQAILDRIAADPELAPGAVESSSRRRGSGAARPATPTSRPAVR